MNIIDFHIHPFYNAENNFCKYDNTVTDYKQVKTDLMKAGITKACGSVIRRGEITDFQQIRDFNDEAIKLRELYGDFYVPGIHIHSGFVRKSCDELERMSKRSVKLVGELVPYLMGWEAYFDKNMMEIYDCIAQLGMVVSVHTMSEETLEQAVKSFPSITFVAAHPGDKETFLRHIERIKKYPNYYLDFSGTGIFRYGLIKYGVEQVGSEHFLFGTDYPICSPLMYVSAVDYENISEADKENIFYINAKRILNLI